MFFVGTFDEISIECELLVSKLLILQYNSWVEMRFFNVSKKNRNARF